MDRNTREMWFNGIKIAFFFQKVTEYSLPDFYSLRRLGLIAQILVCNAFIYSTRLPWDISTFLTIGLSPLPLAKSCLTLFGPEGDRLAPPFIYFEFLLWSSQATIIKFLDFSWNLMLQLSFVKPLSYDN